MKTTTIQRSSIYPVTLFHLKLKHGIFNLPFIIFVNHAYSILLSSLFLPYHNTLFRQPSAYHNNEHFIRWKFRYRLFEVVETLGRVHLVTEWIQGGELYNRINQDGPLKEIHAAVLFKQLLLAVQHMV